MRIPIKVNQEVQRIEANLKNHLGDEIKRMNDKHVLEKVKTT
jgi:hypothetical protein